VALLVVASLLPALSAQAAGPAGSSGPRAGLTSKSVPVRGRKPKVLTRSQTDGKGITTVDHATLPGAASADVAVGTTATAVTGMPLALTGLSMSAKAIKALGTAGLGTSAPTKVHLNLFDQKVAAALGVRGVVLSLARTDGVTTSGTLHVKLDFSSFANAFGANFGARLRLVQLPACALNTPQVTSCQTRTDLGAVNAGGALTGDVTVPGASATSATIKGRASGGVTSDGLVGGGGGVVLAATSSNSSADGTFGATSLSPAYAWSAGNQGGSFSFNYPLRVPASIGGPSPQLSLSYDSGSVDAQTLAENGQTSWAGEGWDLQTGYIERSYRTCSLDGGTTPDMCWFSNYNATMVFDGSSVRLIRDNTSGVWHASSDSALKIEHLTDTSKGNGDNDGEYWRVTTQDGTQYYFGVNKRYSGDSASTNSTQVEPVYGNNSGEPCNASTFANSRCNQAYRWNLDYVVDARGNSMTYFYTKTSGKVGVNNDTATTTYDIDAKLDHIDYGTRAGSEATQTAPMQVFFVKSGRCINTCQPNTSDYPDTPWDLYCTSTTTCTNNVSPSFWTQYKLSTVYTQVWSPVSSSYHKVDQWDMTYTYPSSGDNISPAGADTSPNLWLQTVTHTGYGTDGTTTLAEPPLTFGGTAMFNRIDWGNDIGVAPFVHYRLTSIANGQGGQTLITYSGSQCDRSFQPLTEDNPYRCFQEYFKPASAPAGWGWFNKYVVTGVTNRDLTGGSPDDVYAYAYSIAGTSDPTLWHHDYNETSTLAFRTWSLWQGYSTVTITHGAPGGTQSVTRNLYYRGMDGDGKATADNSGMLWNNRRVSLTTPVLPAGAGAISGTGGLCLNLQNGWTVDGTNIEMGACTGAANQQFFMRPSATSATGPIVNQSTGKCLDITGAGKTNGTNVELWTCNGGAGQVWQRQPDGSFKNPNSGRCLDNNGATVNVGANVDIWDCANNQYYDVWLQRDNGAFVQPQERRCLDITGNVTTDGTKVENWACNAQSNQQWQLQADGTLQNPASGKCIDLIGSGTTAGTQIQIEPCTGADNQVWTNQSEGTLMNPVSGLCLDATSAPANGSLPSLQTCDAASLAQQWADNVVDADGSQGFQRESDQLDGSGNIATSDTHIPTVAQTAIRSAPVSGGQDLTAHMMNNTDTWSRTWLSQYSIWRWTETQTAFNSYGLPTQVTAKGDVSTDDDDTCTTISYVTPDTTKYLVNFASQSITTDCAASPGDADYLAGQQTFYDGSTTLGATPTVGLPTLSNVLASVSSGAMAWAQSIKSGYDANGRVTSTYDALNRQATTAYTPSSGAPVTQITTTNPLGWTSTTTVDPGKGSITGTVDVNAKTTTASYDPLGRLVKVWLNNRSSALTPDRQFTYAVSASVPNSVQTQVLGPSGNQVSSYTIYDGLLRPRQSQGPASDANGGRVIADTAYDSRGMAVKESQIWNGDSGPSSTLASFADTDVLNQHRTIYDALEEPTNEQLWSGGVMQWQTTLGYQGDRVVMIPPDGANPVSKLVDAAGNVVELRQLTTSSQEGPYESTFYTYDRLNRPTSMTDASGNQWSWTYDLRNRLISSSDPNKGTTTATYDDAGEVLSTTDSRPVTVSNAYDGLGRVTAVWNGAVGTGTKLADYTYDTLDKGELTSATSYSGGNAYTTAVTGYDDAYRPLGQSITLPTAEGVLAGTYTYGATYNVDGSPATSSIPATGDLPAETLTTTYDSTGHPLTLSGIDSYISSTTYYPWGPVNQRILGSGDNRVRLTTVADQMTGRVTSDGIDTEHPGAPDTWDERRTDQYTYTPSGDVTSIAETLGGSTVSNQCFNYDPLQRLADAWTTTADTCQTTPDQSVVGGPDPYWSTWTYDALGDRTSQVQHDPSGDTTSTYTYPIAGTPQAMTLTGTSTTGPAGTFTTSYGYDPAGNTTSRNLSTSTQTLSWTPKGQLDTQTIDGESTSYVYDASGARLLRKDPDGTVTAYLPGQELRKAPTGTLTTIRMYGVAVRTASSLTWLASNTQGTALVAIESSTLDITSRRFTPFGEVRGSSPASWPDDHGFVGGIVDPTGLTHLGAREYDSAIGRFISGDPMLNGQDPQSLNGYAYADNSPISGSDPSGLSRQQGDAAGSNLGGACDDTCQAVQDKRQQLAADEKKKADAEKTAASSFVDVLKKQGLSLLLDLLGVNDLINCFGSGSVGACVSLALNFIPWGKLFDVGKDLFRALDDGFKAFRMWRRVVEDAEHLIAEADDAIVDAERELDAAANAYKEDQLAAKNIAEKCETDSFSPDTPILMADGTTKPIKDVKVGDHVASTDPRRGGISSGLVVKYFVNEDTQLTDVTVRTGHTVTTIHTTQNHLFYDDTRDAWVNAADLGPADHLHTPTPTATATVVVAVHNFTGHADRRDLTVAVIHTFYVVAGTTPVLVHNCSIGNKFNVPNKPGVYTIHLADGKKYVGSATSNMRARVNAALMDPDHAVASAGYSIPSVVNVTWIEMPARRISTFVARSIEQSVMDGVGGELVDGAPERLVNRNYPELRLWYHS
jgi:RHS repeat-associated protein